MKKIKVWQLIVVVLVLIMICLGFLLKTKVSEITDDYETMGDNEEINHPELNSEKIYPDKEFVFQKDIVCEETSEESFYSLSLPFINLKLKEANEINSKLEKYYNMNKDYYNEDNNTDKNTERILPSLYYEWFLLDDILELKITYCFENGKNIYEDYHIDIKNEKFLTRDEMLKHLKIDSDKLNKLIDECLMYSYYNYTSEKDRVLYTDFEDYKKNTAMLFGAKSSIIEDNKYDFEKISNVLENESKSEKYVFDYNKICENCNMCFINNNEFQITNICVPNSSYSTISINTDLKYVIPTYHNYTVSDTFEGKTFYRVNKVPFINIDSDDVYNINKELRKYFDNLSQICDKTEDYIVLGTLNGSNSVVGEVFLNREMKKVIDEYYGINYAYTIINDKVLSIVVLEEKNPGSYGVKSSKYLNYNIDIETGKIISNKDFIELFNMDERAFKEKLDTKLKLVSQNKVIPYDFDKLQITFYNPGYLFFEPYYKANNVENWGYCDDSIKYLSVLGKNFDTYPHVWVDVFFDENEDEKTAGIREKQSVLDVSMIDEIIDKYDGINSETKMKLQDNKDVLYYLFDFDNDGVMECIISYDNVLYVYRKSMKEPLYIHGDLDDKIYEVKNIKTNKNEIFIKNSNKHDLCFEDFMLASLSMENNSFVYRTAFGYSCNTEKEKQLREDINKKSFDNYEERQKALLEAHTLNYYYNVNYYTELMPNLGMEYIIVNDLEYFSKDKYDEYSKEFLDKYKLVYTNDDDSIFN